MYLVVVNQYVSSPQRHELPDALPDELLRQFVGLATGFLIGCVRGAKVCYNLNYLLPARRKDNITPVADDTALRHSSNSSFI